MHIPQNYKGRGESSTGQITHFHAARMFGSKRTIPWSATAGDCPATISASEMRLYLIALALALSTLYQGVRAIDRTLHPEAWADRAAHLEVGATHQF